ncbi:MAG TPA: ATP synthase subunit I [Hyphomicrobiales bacterium]|nr:ATP synthase subunit I [Hyphomicrobiales bacterium]
MSAIQKPPVNRVILLQAVITLMAAATAHLFFGTVVAYSVLLGGLLSLVPNAYFAYRVTRHTGARATEKLVKSAYFAEAMKLALTGAGFALVFTQVRPLHVVGLFCGYVLVQLAGLVGLARMMSLEPRRQN